MRLITQAALVSGGISMLRFVEVFVDALPHGDTPLQDVVGLVPRISSRGRYR